MKLLQGLGVVFLGLILVIVGYLLASPLIYPTYSHRYRLTLEVETPDGLKTASSVIEASLIKQPKILTDRSVHTGLKGDAVFLDLGNGKNVTALLALGPDAQDVDGPVTLAVKAFDCTSCLEDLREWRQLANAPGTRNLPPNLIPSLVTISDINDPKTARTVQPDEFESVFVPGYRFKRARIEMTNDPVSRGIESKLPFLVTHHKELTKLSAMPAHYVPRLGQFTAGGD